MIVIIELVFAFGLGLSCILFSINLVKAVRFGNISEDVMSSQAFVYNDLMHGTNGLSTHNNLNRDVIITTSGASVAIGVPPELADAFIREGALSHSYSVFSDPESGTNYLGEERASEAQNISLMEGILKNFTEYIRVW